MSDPSAPWPTPPGEGPAAREGLVEHLAEEMARRWQQGDRAPAEEYLARHPELWGQPEAALELV
jgi:hypothetical protein